MSQAKTFNSKESYKHLRQIQDTELQTYRFKFKYIMNDRTDVPIT